MRGAGGGGRGESVVTIFSFSESPTTTFPLHGFARSLMRLSHITFCGARNINAPVIAVWLFWIISGIQFMCGHVYLVVRFLSLRVLSFA